MGFEGFLSVPKDKVRYLVGIKVSPGDKSADDSFTAAGYLGVDLPATKADYAEFPMTGILSIIIGVNRVYPKLGAANKDAGPYVEVTTTDAGYTEYYGILENRKAFLVGLQDPVEYAKANLKQ
ncbi:hypothetical protein T484DRAFT_1888141 [Baffinella frigidus]|nr:hypothetical protein T484DRAFT_1888141 [Cryptophyta sp. CCMP2293]